MAGKKAGTKKKANDDCKNEDSASNWMSIFFTVAIGKFFKMQIHDSTFIKMSADVSSISMKMNIGIFCSF